MKFGNQSTVSNVKIPLKSVALLIFTNTCPFEKELSLFGFALNRL